MEIEVIFDLSEFVYRVFIVGAPEVALPYESSALTVVQHKRNGAKEEVLKGIFSSRLDSGMPVFTIAANDILRLDSNERFSYNFSVVDHNGVSHESSAPLVANVKRI